uniref:G_PROTEIN_RECEP_F1_2 domain-containing protein n=1 Tax=Rhabditophanes sp. KR3021 TaxID=114890 RepID=A0AC35U793_9BILA
LGNCAYILGALIGIPANFIVLQRIISTKELRISVSYLFIFNLALADLFFLSGTPLMVSNSIQNTWKFGTFMCKAFLASNGANQFASSLFMALLSLDRYTAICCKGKIKDYKTQCSAIFLCTISWLIIFLAIFPLYYFGTIVCMLVWSGSDKGDALFGDNLDTIENLEFSRKIFTAYTFALGYIIPLMAIWYFYGNIIYAVWRQGTSSLIANRNLRKRTMKITWLGVSIALIYSFCWFPFWYVQWSIEEMSEWTLRHDLLMPISYMAYVLCYFNSVINPFAFINYSNRIKQQVRHYVIFEVY